MQFIRIIMNEDRQYTTPEEMQTAFDCFMQYCKNCLATSADFQNMLFIHEILSTYSLRETGSAEPKKKSPDPCLCA